MEALQQLHEYTEVLFKRYKIKGEKKRAQFDVIKHSGGLTVVRVEPLLSCQRMLPLGDGGYKGMGGSAEMVTLRSRMSERL